MWLVGRQTSLTARMHMFCLNDNYDVGRLDDHKSGKSGVVGDFYEHGKLVEFLGNSVQPRGKFLTNNSFMSITCFCNTTRSWTSNKQSLVNFGDGYSVLVTCHIAVVDVE